MVSVGKEVDKKCSVSFVLGCLLQDQKATVVEQLLFKRENMRLG